MKIDKKFEITTYEGISRYEGEKVFMVEWKPFLISQITCVSVTENIYQLFDRHIFFSTHESALEYILLNKQCLSVIEIANEIGWFIEKEKIKVDFDEIVSLLKSLVFGKIPSNRNNEINKLNRI
jgi:hypothetical protein